MIVVDATVVVVALIDGGVPGVVARARLADEALAAPALLDLEVTSALRGLVLGGKVDVLEAERALVRLAALPVDRAPHGALIPRCWQLRTNVTVYDAAYVALAELLGVPLVTSDARLADAPGTRCTIELLSA